MTESKKPGTAFKGYPLLDFVHPDGFSLDHILGSTSLRTELERHIRAFAVSESEPSCGNSQPRRRGRPEVANPYVGLVATDGGTSQSFKEQLVKFLDGLYLGCFQSSAIQKDPRRPAQRYIYDIGFNTDKPTGFIVANPFDTLVTFGPRGRHSPYGVLNPAILGLPAASTIKVERVVPKRKGAGAKGTTHNPDLVGTFGTAVVGGLGGDEGRSSILCDLNIRIVTNHNQQLQQLSLYGDTLKVHLSKGLVQPVERSATNKWVGTGKRLAIPMGNRMITLRRDRLPTWGGPLDLGGATVTITGSGVVGRLHRVDLGGTVEKPLIIFDDVEILA
jgi:hypothetical protein